jgi:hypothetical protein
VKLACLAPPANDDTVACLREVAERLAVPVEFIPKRPHLRELEHRELDLPGKNRPRVRRRDDRKLVQEGAAMKVDDCRALNEFDAPKEVLLIVEGRDAPHVALARGRTFEEFTERDAKRGPRFGVRERARYGDEVTFVGWTASVEVGLREVDEHHAPCALRSWPVTVRNRLLGGRFLGRPAVKFAKTTVAATCAEDEKADGSRADMQGPAFLAARWHRSIGSCCEPNCARPGERPPEPRDHRTNVDSETARSPSATG